MPYVAALVVCAGMAALGWLASLGGPSPAKASTPPRARPIMVAKNAPPRVWKRITTPRVSITSGKAYAGVIQLSGLEATFGDASDVEAKLRELAEWSRLVVSEKPITARFPVPWSTELKPDRYWALGVAASSSTETEQPEQVIELWVR